MVAVQVRRRHPLTARPMRAPLRHPLRHEHACIRCPMLHVDPATLERLDDIHTDLTARRKRAQAEGWLGELEGIDLTLRFLTEKRAEAQRITRIPPTSLGCPPPGRPSCRRRRAQRGYRLELEPGLTRVDEDLDRPGGCAPGSWTGSPTAATSSRPAPTPTGSPPRWPAAQRDRPADTERGRRCMFSRDLSRCEPVTCGATGSRDSDCPTILSSSSAGA